MLVVAVGPQSEWGKTMALVGEAGDSETPLQERLGWMATSIGKVGRGKGPARHLLRDFASDGRAWLLRALAP